MNLNYITIQGQRHDLVHLKNFSFTVVQAAEPNKPERKYKIDVIFNLHCIAREVVPGDHPNELITYDNETRCFCPERYELSARLPGIVCSLDVRKCRNTGKGNYLTVEVIDANGERLDYELYFTLTKPGKKQNLKLVVESAYVRRVVDPYRSTKKPIGFLVLAHNVKHGRRIRA